MNNLIDNRDKIKSILVDDFFNANERHEYIFYVVQVLLRKKDGNELDNFPVFQKTINSADQIDKIFDAAIDVANKHNGRVYISISPKNKEKASLKFANKLIEMNINNAIDTKSLEAVMYSCLTQQGLSSTPRMILDFDVSMYNDNGNYSDDYNIIINVLNDFHKNNHEFKYHIIPTIYGFHVLTDIRYMNLLLDNFNQHTDENFRKIIKRTYMINNHIDILPNKLFKGIISDMIHKESANTLVYYNGNFKK